jgi:glycosyltransferase involved in cell wall biosynthesis
MGPTHRRTGLLLYAIRTGVFMEINEIDLLLEAASGGACRHTLDLYQHLEMRGWPVKLLLSPLRIDEVSRGEIERIPRDKIMFLPLKRSPHWTDIPAIVKLRRYFKSSGKRHLIHAHSTKAGILGAVLSRYTCGNVFTPHAYRGTDPTLRGWKSALVRSAERCFSQPYDVIIGVSEAECAYARGLGVPSSKLQLIPLGIDSTLIASVARKCKESKGNTLVIGFVGRMTYQKNPALFLDAFSIISRALTKATALLVGDGPLLDEMKSYARTLGISDRIVWAGGVSAIEQLGTMDLLIHTSRYESFGYILLEAAAASLPIVAVENDGSRAIFQERLPGYLVPSGTASDLAQRAIMFLSDSEKVCCSTECAVRIAQELSIDTMVDKITNEYEAILRRKP